MDWVEKSKQLPKENTRILIFSSKYLEEDNETMLYRIIDSQFINMMSDVTHWAYLTCPTG